MLPKKDFSKKVISVFLSLLMVSWIISQDIIWMAIAATSPVVPIKATITYPVAYTAGTNSYSAWEIVNKPLSWAWVKFKFVMTWPGISGGQCIEEKVLPVINWLLAYDLGSIYLSTTGASWCNVSWLAFNTSYAVNIYWDLTEPSNGVYTDTEDFHTVTSWNSFPDDTSLNSFLDSKTLSIQNTIYSKTLTLSGGTSGGGSSWAWSSLAVTYSNVASKISSDLITQWKAVWNFDLNWDGYDDIIAVDPYPYIPGSSVSYVSTAYWKVSIFNPNNWWYDSVWDIPFNRWAGSRASRWLREAEKLGKNTIFIEDKVNWNFVLKTESPIRVPSGWRTQLDAYCRSHSTGNILNQYNISYAFNWWNNWSGYYEDGTTAGSSFNSYCPTWFTVRRIGSAEYSSATYSHKFRFWYGDWDQSTFWPEKIKFSSSSPASFPDVYFQIRRDVTWTKYYLNSAGKLISASVKIPVFKDWNQVVVNWITYIFDTKKKIYVWSSTSMTSWTSWYVSDYLTLPTFAGSNLNNWTGWLWLALYNANTTSFTSFIEWTKTALTGIDGVYYTDLNNDSKLDIITYIKSDSLFKYKVYLMNSSNWYTQILWWIDWLTGASIKASVSLTSNIVNTKSVNDVIIFNNWTRSFYKLNADQLWMTNVANIIADWIQILNKDWVSADWILTDNLDTNKNRVNLLTYDTIGVVSSKGLNYNNYSLKYWNWTSLTDIQVNKGWVLSQFNSLWDAFFSWKLWTSNFYMFAVDAKNNMSTDDYTSVYVLRNWEIRELIIDAKKDWGYVSFYKRFWIYDIVINWAKWGILQFDTPVSYTRQNGGVALYSQLNFDVKKDWFVEDNITTATAQLNTDTNTLLSWLAAWWSQLFDIDRHYLDTERATVYSAVSWLTWWYWSPAVHNWTNSNVTFWYIASLFTAWRWTIWTYASSWLFNSTNWIKLLLTWNSASLWIVWPTIAWQPIINFWTDTTKHYVNNLRSYTWIWFTQVNWYMWNDTVFWETIYADNWWLWFTLTSNIKTTTASTNRWIPYLDTAGILLGRSSIVFGDNTWSDWVGWYGWTNADYGKLNFATYVSLPNNSWAAFTYIHWFKDLADNSTWRIWGRGPNWLFIVNQLGVTVNSSPWSRSWGWTYNRWYTYKFFPLF